MTRRIGIVTTSRADYGIFRPVIRATVTANLQPCLFVGGTHLSKDHGNTVGEIEADGFEIVARIKMLPQNEGPVAVSEAMSMAMAGMGRALAKTPVDLLLVLGDRFEMLGAALGAVPFGIPIAHLHGGELTVGAFDDSFRHALTKLAHLHFPATAAYGRRIAQMGEEPWRITVSGAPALDSFFEEDAMPKAAVEAKFGVRLDPAPILVCLHAETIGEHTPIHLAEVVIEAVSKLDGPVIITAPNADPGGIEIATRLRAFASTRSDAFYVESFGARAYRAVLASARLMVGNSSSAIIEAPSFALPVVNLGSRQEGRVRAANVIDVPSVTGDTLAEAVDRAASPAFRNGIAHLINPYGDGHASGRIVDVLSHVALDRTLMTKRFQDCIA